MADGAARKQREIGRAAANVHQTNADLHFVAGQAGCGGCQRLQHQFLHIEATTADALFDVFGRRDCAGHDVDLHFQTAPTHS